MEKQRLKKLIFSVYFLIFNFSFLIALFASGCGIAGIIASPTSGEKKIPAEYDLAKPKEQKKILVLVKQPGWLTADTNLRYYLTKAMNKTLTQKVGILDSNLISYERLSEFRSDRADFEMLSPSDIGRALGADMVLLVEIANYQLHEIQEAGCYKGKLGANAALFDAVKQTKVWPEQEGSKTVSVAFDIGPKGAELAVEKLAADIAFCTVRYFYDCPKDKFKIADDISGEGWKNWEN